MRRFAWPLLLTAAIALGACASASATDQVAVALRIEKVRAHLLAADANATAGRWDLAAVHAAHPAEDLQPIDAALSKRDAEADAELRGLLIKVRETIAAHTVGGTGPRDLAVASAIAAADASVAAAGRVIGGDRVSETPFRVAVAAELLELMTTEYAEGIVNGALRAESEYQDAYAFFARAQTLVGDADLGAAGPAIRDAMRALAAALPGITAPSTPVPAERVEALADEARDALVSVAGSALATTTGNDLAGLVAQLDAASTALAAGDAHGASEAMTAFRGTWVQAEGRVKTRSADAYAHIEKDLAIATAALAARPAEDTAARDAIVRMRADITPFVASATYGVFDAALILLREGVEALLIVAALLAFLARTGNASKRRWVWVGGGAGVLASVAIAIAVTVAFSASASAGVNRELMEGLTGLFAAVMLIYMSWWLHSKATLSSWNRYIRDKSGAALARNSLFGLSVIAFLAVFREGAETALFYVGMAPSIALWDLIAGLAIASAVLVAIGVLVLAFEMRIPIRPFFLGTSVLVYYLAFKFIGTGIHALQVAGVVPANPRSYLPDLGAIGAFPTIETSVIQGALLAIAAGWLLLHRRGRSAVEQPAG